MNRWIKNWQDFADSLSTKGGNIVMLFLGTSLLAFLLLHVVHDQTDSGIVSAIHDLMIGFGGALLGGLSGNSSRQQMADRIETASASQKVQAAKDADPVPVEPVEPPK